jgi:phosphate starvation-inducible protein PhoH and related proteins
MAEKSFVLEDIMPVELFGPGEEKLEVIRGYFPKVKIVARGEVVKVIGDDVDLEYFGQLWEYLLNQYQHYGELTRKHIHSFFLGVPDELPVAEEIDREALVFGRGGKVIKALTPNQRRMVKSSRSNDMLFAIGPAGTGKTYTAVALAVRALRQREVKRIILARPAVEAGENLGFLPGDLRDKLDPYLQPLYDALKDMLPHQKLQAYLEDGTIEIAPLAFMRGRTLDHAFAILDEAQNATPLQLKMFLTRMGKSAKFVITGDITQIDLPRHQKSGLLHATQILKEVQGIDFVFLDERDIVRHELVTRVLKAYHESEDQVGER